MDEVGAGERSGLRPLTVFLHSSLFFHRVIFLVCAILMSVAAMFVNRLGREPSAKTVFSVQSSSRGYVRISGDVRHAGMYPITANAMTMSVIKMADPVLPINDGIPQGDATALLVNGTALHVAIHPNGTLRLTRSQMSANDRLIMGIPLDINSMNVADFDRVPGIGLKMAQRIVEYRHNNGGAMRVTDLIYIEGIGDKKYNNIFKYF